jgi:HK97 family phage portal protein
VLPTQVGTLADSTPIFADATYYSQSYLPMVGQYAAYGALYRSQLWVGILVRKLARATARIPLEVRLGDPDGKNDLEKGPMQALLDQPTPTMTGFHLKQWVAATAKVYGEAFLLKMRDDKGVVRELQPMHPRNVLVRRSEETGDLEYIYTAGTRDWSFLPPIPAADVIPFVTYNPDNINRGVSPLEGLRSTLQNEDAARRANASFWTRGARPSLLLTHPNSLSEAAQERLKRKAEAGHAGPDNMGGIAVFEEGITAQILNLSAEEMQYIESRKLNREEVCAAYDVPPPVVHILDHGTFSNITEQFRSVYRDTMAPDFEDYEAVFMKHLIPDFYPTPGDGFVMFNMAEVLRGDWEKRVTAALQMRQAGLGTGNDGRRLVDLPPIDDPEMDKVYANAALQPLGAKPAEGAAAPASSASHDDPFAPKPEDSAPAGEADQGRASFRALVGRLSRVKGNKAAAKAKLIELHEQQLGAYFDQQRKAVGQSLMFKDANVAQVDTPAWNAQLAQILATLSAVTAHTVGQQIADGLDGDYDPSDLSDWIDEDAVNSAAAINGTTAKEIASRLADLLTGDSPLDLIAQLFAGLVAARIAQIAISRVTSVSLEAGHAAARQNGGKSKTWVVSGPNPRPSHEAMDGESVGLNELFSNGMRGPGDVSGGADEVAGCTCDLSFSKE